MLRPVSFLMFYKFEINFINKRIFGIYQEIMGANNTTNQNREVVFQGSADETGTAGYPGKHDDHARLAG